jgi:hypothetical protein
MRSPSDRPKTTMNRLAETIGASTVCVHSFQTRSVSRLMSQIRPRRPLSAAPGAAVLPASGSTACSTDDT